MIFLKSKFAVLFLALCLFSFSFLSADLIKSKDKTPEQIPQNLQNPQPKYIMKTYGDIIGVYLYGENQPIKLLNVTVKSLPKNDVSALDDGILIYSDEQLLSLTEDFD